VNTFDPNQYDITFAGILLNEGMAEGTSLTIAPVSPGFVSKVGLAGKVTRTRKADKRRTGQLVVTQNSPVNDRLTAVYNADRNAVNGGGVGVFFVQDRAGTSKFRCATAYISQDPDMIVGDEAGNVTWLFEFPNGEITHGSNPETV
jgi:hypothetical protein